MPGLGAIGSHALGGTPDAGDAPEPPAATVYSLFDRETVAPSGEYDPGDPVSLGTWFYTSEPGLLRAIWFWRNAADPTTSRPVALMDGDRNILATGSSSGEPSVAGWVRVDLDTPYAFAPNEFNYSICAVVLYPAGRYPAAGGFFVDHSQTSGPLTAPSRDSPGLPNGNGSFKYAAGLNYPDGSYNGGNYWVDIEFATGGDVPDAVEVVVAVVETVTDTIDGSVSPVADAGGALDGVASADVLNATVGSAIVLGAVFAETYSADAISAGAQSAVDAAFAVVGLPADSATAWINSTTSASGDVIETAMDIVSAVFGGVGGADACATIITAFDIATEIRHPDRVTVVVAFDAPTAIRARCKK